MSLNGADGRESWFTRHAAKHPARFGFIVFLVVVGINLLLSTAGGRGFIEPEAVLIKVLSAALFGVVTTLLIRKRGV